MTEPARNSCELPAILDLTAAAPLASALLARRGTPLTVDASGVRKLGGLCLQVLLSARATWATDKIPFAVTKPSIAFQKSLAQFGAGFLLN